MHQCLYMAVHMRELMYSQSNQVHLAVQSLLNRYVLKQDTFRELIWEDIIFVLQDIFSDTTLLSSPPLFQSR